MAEKKSYIYEIIIDTRSGLASLNGTDVALGKLGQTIRRVQTDTHALNKGLGDNKDASGLASAATVELGRTFSDAGYGIQGVTNNIQQLGSLFTTLMGRKNGTGGVLGFKGALDLMLKSLSGPLGAIVMFQAATAAIEYFSRKVKEAREEVVDFTDALRVDEVTLQALSLYATTSADALDALKRNFKEVGDFLNAAESTGVINDEVIEFAKQWGFQLLTARTEIEKLTAKMKKEQEAGEISESTAMRLAKAYEAESKALRMLNAEKLKEVVVEGDTGGVVIDPITQTPLQKLRESGELANEHLRELQDERFNYFERSDKLRTKSEKIQSNERLKNLEAEAERRAMMMLAIGEGVQSLGYLIGKETQAGKAVAAAGALIETYSAITKTLAAFAGQPIPGYAIAQAIATGLFGFEQVKKIYEVNVPGGSGGGAGVGAVPSDIPIQQPDFNIVGVARGNQIRDTIQSALGKPIRAYVTTKDVRTGEELDRNIVRGASVG